MIEIWDSFFFCFLNDSLTYILIFINRWHYIIYQFRLKIAQNMIRTLFLSRYFVRKTKLANGQHDFLDLIKPPSGSKIKISDAQKEKINKQIDQKMQELQDTGLSKQEILLSKGKKGLPLKIDPFFQFLKQNRLARQIYLRPEDRFTVEKVVDIALRQDIGPDPSYSNVRLSQRTQSKYRFSNLENLEDRNEKNFDPAVYDANTHFSTEKAYDQLKPHQAIRHIYSPIDKYQRLKKNLRKLNKYDIHWRNIELLQQFLTYNGNIKPRIVNCISKMDQHRVQKAIKTSRIMHALPHYGRILPTLRRSITSIQDDVKQIGYQHINIETGQIYLQRTQSMDSIQVEQSKINDLNNKYRKMLQNGENYRLWSEVLESPPSQQFINSEKYARSLKIKQNQVKPAQSLKKLSKNEVLNKIGLQKFFEGNQQEQKIEAADNEDTRRNFENRKNKIKKQMENNPFSFSQILFRDKTEL